MRNAILLVVSLVPCAVLAGEYNKVLEIGDPMPIWNDLPGTDGAKHSADDLSPSKVVVVAFTCNSCPYAVDAEDRLKSLNDKFSQNGVTLVAINVNKVEEDLMPAMKRRAEEKGFQFAYLFDESQQIAKDFGANYTPEFFVFDHERKLVYMGSFDDSPDGRKVAKGYIEDAVEKTLAGEAPSVTETVPIGCRIRFERTRRSRRKAATKAE